MKAGAALTRASKQIDNPADLEHLLPVDAATYAFRRDNSIRYPSGGCGSISCWRATTFGLLFIVMGICSGWFIHCAVFMDTEKSPPAIDTNPFFSKTNSEMPQRIEDLEKMLGPGLFDTAYSNGSVDLNKMKLFIALLNGKNVSEVKIPPKVMSRLAHHLQDVTSHDYQALLQDLDLMQGLLELITQRPMVQLQPSLSVITDLFNKLLKRQEEAASGKGSGKAQKEETGPSTVQAISQASSETEVDDLGTTDKSGVSTGALSKSEDMPTPAS